MSDPQNVDEVFRQAVSAMDAGNVAALERLLAEHPELVHERLEVPGAWLRDGVGEALDGFFQRRYLLWFVAEDPVRNRRLPANTGDIARVITQAAQRGGVGTLKEQLDDALRLVAWSGVAADSGVQLELIDALVDAGASPEGVAESAFVNGHVAAAEHLIERGAIPSLATALCLGHWSEAGRLAEEAGEQERKSALVLAALNGQAAAIRLVIEAGVAPSAPSTRSTRTRRPAREGAMTNGATPRSSRGNTPASS